MSERQPYSRVYWSIRQDPKFRGIYSDDHHLAAWLRLLIAADATWPAPADIPANARKSSVTALSECGLVDLLGDGMFTIHGLDAERGRRREAASRGPSATQTEPKRDPDARSRAGVAELRQDETSRDNARDSLDRYHELTGFRPWGQWSGDTLLGLERDFGLAETVAALDAENADGATRDTLLKRTAARLARDAEHAKRAAAKRPRIVKPAEDREAINAEIRRLMATPAETA